MAEEQQKSDAAKREEATLAWWQERDIFKKSLEKDAPHGEYVFYDGPPFATGLPHYGHIVASILKDAVPRYWTMRGYRVPRVWGWDCHGLPIENIVEKELGFKHKKDIKEYGVANFNERCREQVLTYVNEWEKVIPRIGRWADMKNAYRTMDMSFMESVWSVFKRIYDSGLVYEDYRSMHICPRCETTLSQQEVAEGYKDVKDIAVTVKFKLVNSNEYILAWTTTPWTLPGNVALAVGPDITYAKVHLGGDVYWLAKDRVATVAPQATILEETKGRSLVGKAYEPLFDYYASDEKLQNREKGWRVYAADFVTTDTGTGIAHEAPAFGADDWDLLKKVNLPFVQHVNMDGTMKEKVTDFVGLEVKPNSDDDRVRLGTDIAVLKYLQEKGAVFAKENIVHSYPHCWRCDTPLLNYATSSWFVNVTKIKAGLQKNAEGITWSPDYIKEGRFGKWLEGARDWSISRQRFWASVIPLWHCAVCNKNRVFGSASALEEASGLSGQGKKISDLHKHVVDEIEVPCECGAQMRRIPDVLDTWFDSGSMPYGQVHYPFEHKERFEKTFPAQFIAEGLDQTRAWFYYLHVLAGALFGKSAFKNVIVNGIVLAEDGKKMSKKLQNYPDPMKIVDTYGADALRYYLLTSPVVQAENLAFSERGVDEVVKKNLGRLGNVLAFYQLYADDTPRDWKSPNVLDRWIMTRLDQLIIETTAGFDSYRMDAATRPLAKFIDDFSVWYLRRSRERFKDDTPDKKNALATLRYTLHRVALVCAPSMPFFAEHLFQAVREGEDEESVHLALWPQATATANFIQRILGRGGVDQQLLQAMQASRDIVSQALELREKAGLKIRQPLASVSIPQSAKLPQEFFDIIADELNVKSVVIGGEIKLDTNITDELKEEGVVRDTMRLVQDARKAAKMKPGEHGGVSIIVPADQRSIVEKNLSLISKQTNTEITLQ